MNQSTNMIQKKSKKVKATTFTIAERSIIKCAAIEKRSKRSITLTTLLYYILL